MGHLTMKRKRAVVVEMAKSFKACINQLKIKQREHFLRATLMPLAEILDGLIGLFTYGLVHFSFTMKAVLIISKKELKATVERYKDDSLPCNNSQKDQ